MSTVYCSNCSNQMSSESKACPKCGHPNKNLVGLKSKVAFVLLALFLGGLGVHRMYLGDWLLGVIYLVFFWTGVPMVIAFIEAVVIGLRPNDPRFDT